MPRIDYQKKKRIWGQLQNTHIENSENGVESDNRGTAENHLQELVDKLLQDDNLLAHTFEWVMSIERIDAIENAARLNNLYPEVLKRLAELTPKNIPRRKLYKLLQYPGVYIDRGRILEAKFKQFLCQDWDPQDDNTLFELNGNLQQLIILYGYSVFLGWAEDPVNPKARVARALHELSTHNNDYVHSITNNRLSEYQ